MLLPVSLAHPGGGRSSRPGALDLTDLALSFGYADHSHMTNAFRRGWEMPPSRFRAFDRSGKKFRNCLARHGPKGPD